MFLVYEPPRGKTNNLHRRKTKAQISFAVTAKLISAFVFATRIVQFLFYLNPKFQASSSFLCLYRLVCVRPVRKPHCWFSHEVAHIIASRAVTPNDIMRSMKNSLSLSKSIHLVFSVTSNVGMNNAKVQNWHLEVNL